MSTSVGMREFSILVLPLAVCVTSDRLVSLSLSSSHSLEWPLPASVLPPVACFSASVSSELPLPARLSCPGVRARELGRQSLLRMWGEGGEGSFHLFIQLSFPECLLGASTLLGARNTGMKKWTRSLPL